MMSDFSVENIVWTQVLKEAFGESVELEDDKGHIEVYDIAAEFEVDGQGYAILVQPDRTDEEYEVLRIVKGEDGGLRWQPLTTTRNGRMCQSSMMS